jgi:hypothetical protein
VSIQIDRQHTAVISLLALSACFGLAACGGASRSSTSTKAAATSAAAGDSSGATGTASPGGPRGAARFAAIRECMQKNGITLPPRAPGEARAFGGFLAGGGPHLPPGVTREQFEAALRKCAPGRLGRLGATERLRNPAILGALTKFAACMRENGVNVPAPNTSGNGPIFDTKGIDTSSPQVRTALAKCRTDLRRAPSPRGPGAPGRE